MAASKMTAEDVKAALVGRWPDGKYLHLREACLHPTLSYRAKIDVLVLALWRSNRYEMDAVEVKVSYSDWRKEIESITYTTTWPDGRVENHHSRVTVAALKQIAADSWMANHHGGPGTVARVVTPDLTKNEEWRRRAHRFWIAAPKPLADRIVPELPEGWGLLAVNGARCRAVVKAVTNHPDPLTQEECVALLRGAADAGVMVRQRAYDKGVADGQALEQKRQERHDH